MKKIIIAAFLIIALMFPLSAFGAGSCTKTPEVLSNGLFMVTFACTGDAADGSIPPQKITASEVQKNGAKYFYQIYTKPTPGGTAPDAADVTVNMDNLDLLGGKGANLIHATATQDTLPYNATIMTAWRYPAVTGNISIAVANQATASANFTFWLVFDK